MKQVFLSTPVQIGQTAVLDEMQAHHLFDVLRTASTETIRVVSGGEVFLGHVQEKPELFIFGQEKVSPRPMDITLCTALIKMDKFEWMLQKAAELGVSRIVPFTSSRTVVQVDDKKSAKKMERWNRILMDACRQCNRHDMVDLVPVVSLQELPAFQTQRNLVAYEGLEKDGRHLADYLSDMPASLTVCIGPEGGFSVQEAKWLNDHGFASCRLGNQILRAETAAMYVLCAAEYQSHLPSREAE